MPALTSKDERDISKKLEEALSQLESSQEGLMFQGEPLDDATKELIAISLRNSLEITLCVKSITQTFRLNWPIRLELQ